MASAASSIMEGVKKAANAVGITAFNDGSNAHTVEHKEEAVKSTSGFTSDFEVPLPAAEVIRAEAVTAPVLSKAVPQEIAHASNTALPADGAAVTREKPVSSSL